MDRSDFGQLIFEQRNAKGTTVFLTILAGLAVAGALALGEPLVLAAAGVLALGFVLVGIANAVGAHRCYESGLTKRSLLGERALAYADVEVLSYRSTAIHYSGYDARTNVWLEFLPAKPHKKVAFMVNVPAGHEAQIESLRDKVAAVIAERMYKRMASESEVSWTSSVRLSRSGIRFHKSRLLGSGTEVFVSFAENPRFRFEDGTFVLVAADSEEAVLKIETALPNFYPGLVLFHSLASHEA